ncbi:MAG: DUF2092 domain-containing protein [Betaproteobacteria bacterium]
MIENGNLGRMLLVAAGVLFAVGSAAQQKAAAQPAPTVAKTPKVAKQRAAPAVQMGLEPRAIEILKTASARLAAAKSMAFTAVVSYESPSRLGPPLVYSTKSEVTLQRPDKLKVINVGDGPPSEFYCDGKVMMAFVPGENLVAVADAPPTIDAALQAAYDSAAIYFPFADVIVADPYKDVADGLKVAFYIGQSNVVGGVTTDMVAYVTGDVFVQIWIGAQDMLPRRVYAVYLTDRARLRHVLELSNWQVDAAVPADTFVSAKAAGAQRMAFARPDATNAPGMRPPPKVKAQPTRK